MALAALGMPLRRALYRYVAGRPGDVSRDEAARAVGSSRALAAFHLDKLVDLGLLEVSYRRLSGRSGPGAGRTAKLYRRSAREFAVTLPERRYDLLARLLAEALDAESARDAVEALQGAARRFGKRLGEETRRRAGARPGERHLLHQCEVTLRACGFEPQQGTGSDIRLRNCPFGTLAREYQPLVCGMNLGLMKGLVAGLGMRDIAAVQVRTPGWCCVVFRPRRGGAEPRRRAPPQL